MRVASRTEFRNSMKSSGHEVLRPLPLGNTPIFVVLICGLHSLTSRVICCSFCMALSISILGVVSVCVCVCACMYLYSCVLVQVYTCCGMHGEVKGQLCLRQSLFVAIEYLSGSLPVSFQGLSCFPILPLHTNSTQFNFKVCLRNLN